MSEVHRILVSGEGGQGVQVLSKSLVKAAHSSGQKISYVPNYGVEQRGGVSLGFIQISDQEIGFPKFQNADILVILTERAVPRVKEYITKNTLIIHDETLVPEELLKEFPNQKMAIPAYDIAEKKLVVKAFNIIVLGFLANTIDVVKPDKLKEAVNEGLSAKYKDRPEMKHLNEKALEIGLSGAKEEVKI